MTPFSLCTDAVLREAIGRLSARLERLERSAHAAAESLTVAAVLDEALTELAHREANGEAPA